MEDFFGAIVALVFGAFYIAMWIGMIALPFMGLSWLFS